MNGILISLFLSCYLFMLYEITLEYWTPFALPGRIGLWHIHHDEKLIVPDAKCFLFGNHTFRDYEPPNSAVFGLGSHLIAALGLRIFGLNNLGLRFFPVLVSASVNLLFILIASNMSPGILGFSVGCFWLVSYSNFTFSRHGIVEHYLHAIILFLLYFYIISPAWFIAHIEFFSLLAALSIWFKPNFALYCYLFLFSICLLEGLGISGLVRMTSWYLFALILLEGAQALLMQRWGLLIWRYSIIKTAVKEFSGKALTPIKTSFHPVGLRVFPEFLLMLAEWHVCPKGLAKFYNATLRKMLYGVLIVFGAVVAQGTLRRGLPREAGAIALTVFLLLLSCAPFNFSLKRALLPISLASLLMVAVLNSFFPKAMIPWFALILWILLLLRAGSEIAILFRQKRIRSSGVSLNSKALDEVISPGERLCAHSYAARFFWQAKKPRFLSSDDNAGTNQDIVNRALAGEAGHALLSERGGVVRGRGATNGKELAFVAEYKTGEVDSDEADSYLLFRVEEALRDDAGLQDVLRAYDIGETPMSDEKTVARVIEGARSTPHSPTAVRRAYILASRLKAANNLAASRSIFEALEPAGFNMAGLTFHLGDIALREGRTEDALFNLKKCLSYDPSHKKARELIRATHR
jgi:hypothetical protein